jgi:2-keto-4-pentenoate hydratase/2-oxohepta-3-ene-1,7-dioic acid hydratase in catechol pathway
MRIVNFEKGGGPGIAADGGSGWHGLTQREDGFPGILPELIARGANLLRTAADLLRRHAIDLNAVRILPPVPKPPKILCVGLNYDDHLAESGLKKPGRVMQDASTDQLIFGVPELIEMNSVAISLEPGDAIITGTPGGVGAVRKPPVFMRPGDVFEVEIEGLGVLSNPVHDG